MTRLDPRELFALVAAHVSADLHDNILVVGSLAAAYHYRDQLELGVVTTKDADVVVQPAGALEQCRAIAERLLGDGWSRHPKCFASGDPQPSDALRAIRLYPPSSTAYYIELLGLPELGQGVAMLWRPIELNDGWYGLPCFRYIRLATHNSLRSKEGLCYAAPAVMALANLLAHPELGVATMSETIGGRKLLRSAKDLGRVLALAWFEGAEVEHWIEPWRRALRTSFPKEHEELANRAGDGLRALLADDDALEQARHANEIGLLRGCGVGTEELRAVAERLMAFVVEPVGGGLDSR